MSANDLSERTYAPRGMYLRAFRSSELIPVIQGVPVIPARFGDLSANSQSPERTLVPWPLQRRPPRC
ncbi:MAG: hypothetical protein WBG76_09235, partial [Ornithinimicrobium sp.]